MSGDGVSDVSTGAGKGVGEMVNETDLTPWSIAWSGACGGGSSVGAETCIDNELAEVGRFSKGDRGEFGKKVLD